MKTNQVSPIKGVNKKFFEATANFKIVYIFKHDKCYIVLKQVTFVKWNITLSIKRSSKTTHDAVSLLVKFYSLDIKNTFSFPRFQKLGGLNSPGNCVLKLALIIKEADKALHNPTFPIKKFCICKPLCTDILYIKELIQGFNLGAGSLKWRQITKK